MRGRGGCASDAEYPVVHTSDNLGNTSFNTSSVSQICNVLAAFSNDDTSYVRVLE